MKSSPHTYIFRWNKNQYLKPALALAVAVHAVIILGIQFSEPATSTRTPVWSLNVSLLKPMAERRDPTLLRASQTTTEPAKPVLSSPQESPVKQLDSAPKLITTFKPFPSPLPKSQPLPATDSVEAKPTPIVDSVEAKPTPVADSVKTKPIPPDGPAARAVRVSDLINQGLRQARLTAEQDRFGHVRKKHADLYNTTTPDGAYAAYWVRKVERIGELNLPRTLRSKRSKEPILDVAIRADGTLVDILMIQPSGNKRLDTAIQRIVSEAAPYAPFPDTLRGQCDVLHIKHKWTFR